MVTIVEFRLLVLDSLKNSRKAESPINKSADEVISRRTILLVPAIIYLFIYLLIYLFIYLFIHSFIYLFIFLFIYLFYFIFHIFTENRHYGLICIAIAIVVIGWPEWIKNIYLLLRRLNLAILAYFDKH